MAEAELLRHWRDIEEWLSAVIDNPDYENVRLAVADVVEQEAGRRTVEFWASLFQEELDFVRRARNSVANASRIDDADVVEANLYARRLLALLRERLRELGLSTADLA